MIAIDPFHRKRAPPGMANVLDLPVHPNHVYISVPRLAFHSPFRLLRVASGLPEKRTVCHAMDTNHSFAGLHEFFDGAFSRFAQARAVIVLDEKIIVRESGCSNPAYLFLDPDIEAPRTYEHGTPLGHCTLPGMRKIGLFSETQNPDLTL